MKKNVKFVLPKPSNNDNLNTDFSSRLEYYDDEKNGILNIVAFKKEGVDEDHFGCKFLSVTQSKHIRL
jgi:hypothetical protein